MARSAFPQFSSNDGAVRETNDEAVRAKLSITRLGYYSDPFLEYFEHADPQFSSSSFPRARTSPLMNRGTFARVHAVRKLVKRFLSLESDTKQVVVFGAGEDTLGLNVMKDGEKGVKWVELEFQEVVQRKSAVVTEHMGDVFPKLEMMQDGNGVLGKTENGSEFRVISADLRKTLEVERKLLEAGLEKDVPTLFISECVLIYMKPDDSDRLVQLASKMFTGIRMFIDYEQVEPNDSFGQQMVRNIASRGCPLLGIFRYPTVHDVEKRFNVLGWTFSEAISMLKYYDKHMEPAEKKRVGHIEMLDEFEEWTMLMSHYCLLCAVTGGANDFGAEMSKLKLV